MKLFHRIKTYLMLQILMSLSHILSYWLWTVKVRLLQTSFLRQTKHIHGKFQSFSLDEGRVSSCLPSQKQVPLCVLSKEQSSNVGRLNTSLDADHMKQVAPKKKKKKGSDAVQARGGHFTKATRWHQAEQTETKWMKLRLSPFFKLQATPGKMHIKVLIFGYGYQFH